MEAYWGCFTIRHCDFWLEYSKMVLINQRSKKNHQPNLVHPAPAAIAVYYLYNNCSEASDHWSDGSLLFHGSAWFLQKLTCRSNVNFESAYRDAWMNGKNNTTRKFHTILSLLSLVSLLNLANIIKALLVPRNLPLFHSGFSSTKSEFYVANIYSVGIQEH